MKSGKLNSKKICIVTSSGGHLYQIHKLKNWWSNYPRFWITVPDKFSNSMLKGEKKYYANFPENRNIVNAIKNLILSFKILKKEKPDIIFSTGAGVAPPFFLAAKLLNIKTVFMETFIFVPTATLSGKLIYPLSDYFIVQNKFLLERYKKATFIESVLKL